MVLDAGIGGHDGETEGLHHQLNGPERLVVPVSPHLRQEIGIIIARNRIAPDDVVELGALSPELHIGAGHHVRVRHDPIHKIYHCPPQGISIGMEHRFPCVRTGLQGPPPHRIIIHGAARLVVTTNGTIEPADDFIVFVEGHGTDSNDDRSETKPEGFDVDDYMRQSAVHTYVFGQPPPFDTISFLIHVCLLVFQRYIQQQQQYIKGTTKIFPTRREDIRGWGPVQMGWGEEVIWNSDA